MLYSNSSERIQQAMRIISFDVGMKNLAYCIFSISNTIAFTGASATDLIHHIHIERWDVIDLRFEPNLSTSTTSEVAPPPPPKRTCNNDNKLAKWMLFLGQQSAQTPPSQPSSVVLYCAKCAERSKYKTPSREILPIQRKPELLTKKKLGELMDIKANVCSAGSSQSLEAAATTNLKVRKSDLIEEIKTMMSRDFMEPFDEQKYSNYISGIAPTTGAATTKPKKANYTYAHDLDLITYGRNMMKHLDVILAECSGPIDMMIIENQISTLASRMKTLQGMITQYFIMKHIPMIEFISASCKLKLFTNTPLSQHEDATADNDELCIDASTYADRKKSGIAVCRSLGEISRKHKSEYAKWMPLFETHKKKDDLADCFLQGLWRVHSASAV